MWIVISGPDDMPALWAYAKLKESGLDPVEQITPEEFSYASSCSYSIGRNNSGFDFDLRDGRRVRTEDVRGILNRVTMVPTEHIAYSRDTGYAIQELNAFFLGWLSSLEVPVINRPVPFGLAGSWRHSVEWTWLATNAGLPTAKLCRGSGAMSTNMSYLQNDTGSVVVAGGEIFGESLPDAISNGCIRLSERSKTNMLGITFLRKQGDFIFVSASPFPDIRLGGDKIIKKIKRMLTDGN